MIIDGNARNYLFLGACKRPFGLSVSINSTKSSSNVPVVNTFHRRHRSRYVRTHNHLSCLATPIHSRSTILEVTAIDLETNEGIILYATFCFPIQPGNVLTAEGEATPTNRAPWTASSDASSTDHVKRELQGKTSLNCKEIPPIKVLSGTTAKR